MRKLIIAIALLGVFACKKDGTNKNNCTGCIITITAKSSGKFLKQTVLIFANYKNANPNGENYCNWIDSIVNKYPKVEDTLTYTAQKLCK